MTDAGARHGHILSRLPTGTVTFMFTDIEGSTRLLQRLGDDYLELLDDHNRILREAITTHRGVEVRPTGDAFFAVFADAADAIRAVVDAQLELCAHTWPRGAECRVRIGLHTGEAVNTSDDYIGLAVHQASRISDAGHGRQILLSAVTAQLGAGGLPPGAELHDLGEHRLRDLPEPQRLFEIRHPGLPRVAEPLRTLSARPNNLPAKLTSFVGRDKEMAELKSRLLGGARIVSLVGPGGAGKTRLSLELAGDVLGEFPDGVWFVELAEVSSDALVVQAAATAVGISEEPGQELGTTLRDRLERSRSLLVLDNCEHVVWGAASLVEWILAACADVQIVASSREPLGVDGELTWTVSPLSVPRQDEAIDGSDAVRLFVDRASSANSRFKLTSDNAQAVGEVCRRLDGIPLALELAAARVDLLSINQICERLDSRFQLLTRGSRTALPHHQTLRALVDWSYEMLTPAEQVLLCRLAVFAGGFTIEAADAVVAGDPVASEDVFEALAGLVRRSLVQVDDLGGDSRYGLLETIRQYALAKLEERGEALDVRARHRRWISELAASTRGIDFCAAAIHDRLELETANIRAALESGLTDPDGIEDALGLCADLGYYWWLRGHVSEGESWVGAVLAKAEGVPAQLRGQPLVWLGLLAYARLDIDTAMPLLTEGLEIAEAHGDELLKARAYTWIGACLTMRGELEQARAMLERHNEIPEGVVKPAEEAGRMYLYSSLYWLQGDTESGRLLFEQGIDLARRLRASYVLCRALPVAANLALESGDATRAAELYREALEMARESNDRVSLARSLVYLAETSLESGDFTGAESQLSEAEPIITRQIGYPSLAPKLEAAQGWLDIARGRLEDARVHIERALAIAVEIRFDRRIADARTALGALELAEGNARAAATELERSLELTRSLSNPERTAVSLELLARAAVEMGDFKAAGKALDEATEIASSLGSEARLAAAEHGHGFLALARGDVATATGFLERALARRRAIGNRIVVAETLETLAETAAALGESERRDSLLAEAEALRDEIGCPVPPAIAARLTAL